MSGSRIRAWLNRLVHRRRVPPGWTERVRGLQEVLEANNRALGAIASLQEVLAGERRATPAEVRRFVTTVTVQTYRMVSNLDRMTGGREDALIRRFEQIRDILARRVDVGPVLREVPYVLPLQDLGASVAETVGRKAAFLGEVSRLLPGKVPSGFATTVQAYRRLMDASGLGPWVVDRLRGLDPSDVQGCFRASAEVSTRIAGACVPDDLARALAEAAARLGSNRLAVRSSALMEDGEEASFAGQYRSLLNVPVSDIVESFKLVIASQYTPEALIYRLARGIPPDETAMCCLVLEMVNARTAGVAYSRVETPEGRRTLVQAVRGLGLALVDGSAEPDSFLVDRKTRRVIARKTGMQTALVTTAPAEGTRKVSLGATDTACPALDDAAAIQVSEAVWVLADALGDAVDVEWAADESGRLFVLQVRPQTGLADLTPRAVADPIPGARVLLQDGARASGGAASGPVSRVSSDLDILRCAPGSVVVLAEANPRYAVLLHQAAAVVADAGEVTGHLATVARELRVPALFATRQATRILQPGQIVTVDADALAVYDGRVEQALDRAAQRAKTLPEDSPGMRMLHGVQDLVIPLSGMGRLSSGYKAERCRTLHDIIRYCHQKAIESLFDVGDVALRAERTVRRLRSPVPMDCRVLDLGGGLAANAPDSGDILLEHVACRPLVALWTGMTDPRLRWTVPRSVTARGFLSSVLNYNFDQDGAVRRMGEPSYAFITADSLNLNSRVGYHFSTVDARACAQVERNHLSFRFVGGSTGIEQRSRRATLIERILAAKGFETDRVADLVNARLRHRPAAEMEDALRLLGLLMGFVNHLDMELVSDEIMHAYENAFLRGDYGYKGERDRG